MNQTTEEMMSSLTETSLQIIVLIDERRQAFDVWHAQNIVMQFLTLPIIKITLWKINRRLAKVAAEGAMLEEYLMARLDNPAARQQ